MAPRSMDKRRKPAGDFNYKSTDNAPAWTFVRTTVWFPPPELSRLCPGCGACKSFERCQELKRVRADTKYCQWQKNGFVSTREIGCAKSNLEK
jgi:hypothetical protein